MKTIFLTLALFLSALFVSCEKENIDEPVKKEENTPTPPVNNEPPKQEIVREFNQKLVFFTYTYHDWYYIGKDEIKRDTVSIYVKSLKIVKKDKKGDVILYKEYDKNSDYSKLIKKKLFAMNHSVTLNYLKTLSDPLEKEIIENNFRFCEGLQFSNLYEIDASYKSDETLEITIILESSVNGITDKAPRNFVNHNTLIYVKNKDNKVLSREIYKDEQKLKKQKLFIEGANIDDTNRTLNQIRTYIPEKYNEDEAFMKLFSNYPHGIYETDIQF